MFILFFDFYEIFFKTLNRVTEIFLNVCTLQVNEWRNRESECEDSESQVVPDLAGIVIETLNNLD